LGSIVAHELPGDAHSPEYAFPKRFLYYSDGGFPEWDQLYPFGEHVVENKKHRVSLFQTGQWIHEVGTKNVKGFAYDAG